MKNASALSTPAPVKLTAEQKLVLGYLTSSARGKAHYSKRAAQLDELKAISAPGKEIVLPDGRCFAVVDTFEGAKTLKKTVYTDRFELQQVK